jgi:hypothetical protein
MHYDKKAYPNSVMMQRFFEKTSIVHASKVVSKFQAKLCLSIRSAVGVDKVLLEKVLGFPQSLVREYHRFSLVDRIVE